MKAQTILKKSPETLEENIIFEKKQTSFNFKDFYMKQSLEYSPYLKKENADKNFFFKNLSHYVKSSVIHFMKPDKFSTQKKEINRAFKKLIEYKNFKEMNDFFQHNFVPDIDNYQLLLKSLGKDTEQRDILQIQKQQPLFGFLAQLLFINSHFQIHCQSVLEKLQTSFINENLSVELFSKLYDCEKSYKGVKVKSLYYDKGYLLAAINMHNTCINPQFSMNLFCYALKRVFHHDKYAYSSMKWSMEAVVTTLYPYIQPYLSVEDKNFITEQLISQKDKIFKEGRRLEICDIIDKLYLLMGNSNTNPENYKEKLIEQIQHIYGNAENLSTPLIAHVLPLVIEQEKLLPEHTDLIDNIKSIHGKLIGFESLLQSDKIDQINKVVSETLPLTIEKYTSIDINFRDNIKNVEGKNAHALFSESLENILLVMQDIQLHLEQAKVHELSLVNRKNRIN